MKIKDAVGFGIACVATIGGIVLGTVSIKKLKEKRS